MIKLCVSGSKGKMGSSIIRLAKDDKDLEISGQFDVGESGTIIGRHNDTSWYKVQRCNAPQAWTLTTPQWFQVEGQCDAVPVVQ